MYLEKVKFGGHETFPLRFNWIPKAFQALARNPEVFRSETSTVELGVGKNMVSSIKHWLIAAGLFNQPRKPSPLGQFLFDPAMGADPYLEDEGTLWLLHWLLASNHEFATSIHWFFNSFHKSQFFAEEVFAGLRDFVKENIEEKKRPSEKTLKSDVSVITRMYVQHQVDNKASYEDMLTSPFAELGLLTDPDASKRFSSTIEERSSLPPEILLFAINESSKDRGQVIELDSMMHFRGQHPAAGSIFRLTESSFISKLELACLSVPDIFQLNHSGVLSQLFRLDNISGLEILKSYFKPSKRKAA